MNEELKNIQAEFDKNLNNVSSFEELKEFENSFLWKKWKLSDILKGVKNLSNEEKREAWKLANDIKTHIWKKILEKKDSLEKYLYEKIQEESDIDTWVFFEPENKGHFHPLSKTMRVLEDIFISMWFKIEDGPQAENQHLNFDKLNIPDNHPARDVWDTFWISDDINDKKEENDKLLLRTHTSPVQIRTMLKWELPIKVIVPWRVFRYEQEDARHTSNFYQLEGLVVWEKVTFWDLKWTLETAMKKLLWEKTKLRFRPSIFPFTEPSAEIDVSCQICSGTWHKDGKPCSMCSATGWVELLWAWMVHPKVLEWVGIDPEKYSGFAFGMGIDRIASQRFKISSSRLMYQSKLKLNRQF